MVRGADFGADHHGQDKEGEAGDPAGDPGREPVGRLGFAQPVKQAAGQGKEEEKVPRTNRLQKPISLVV
jgi:hypothetical protein